MELWRGVAVFSGASAAGAFGAMVEDFTLLEHLLWRGDFVSVRGEDDAVDGVVGIGFDERSLAEIDAAGAPDAGVGVGSAVADAFGSKSESDKIEIVLNGGAVLGKDEGNGHVRVGGIEGNAGLFDSGPALAVVVAEEGSVDGGRAAAVSVGLDVTA